MERESRHCRIYCGCLAENLGFSNPTTTTTTNPTTNTMTLLSILYWLILILAAIGAFAVFTYSVHVFSVATLLLFILIGLKVFRTPLQ